MNPIPKLCDPRTLPRKLRGALPYAWYRLRGKSPEHVSEGVLRVDTWWGPILVHEQSNGITDQLKRTGVYDLDVCLTVLSIVQRGMTVLNIGANIGIYALLAARRCGKKGKVYAFEPDPRSFALLQENARQYPGVIECLPYAVSEKEGEMTLFLDEAEPGDSSFAEGNSEGGKAKSVRATTVDAFLKNNNRTADVIIMDIQGAEPLAFEGALHTLRSFHPLTILFECSPQYSENMGTSVDRIHALLAKEGFRLSHLRSSSLPDPDHEWNALVTELKKRKGGYGFCNLLAVRS